MTSQTPPPPPGADPLLGRVLDGRYRIEGLVARGGMATVYRGADLRLDRTVAIKVMHPSFASDPGFVERFEREARAAARLTSAHVVSVHDQGNDAGVTYLVMEFIPGHTVRDVLRAHGPLPPAQALSIIDPVLEALAAAHRAGYIHRDVKPENVLISEDGRVKVTDFGLARAIEGADSGKTHGLLLGTVAYLSPEQVEHDSTDARSDVYGAGVLLFELVTGKVPFSAATPMQVAYKHVHEDVPLPSSVRPGLPAQIDTLVQRATRRAPDARFSDADAFLRAVRVLRATLPAAQPWAPTPHDTLVVARGDAEPGSDVAGAPEAGAAGAGAAAAGAAGAGAAGAGDKAAAAGVGSTTGTGPAGTEPTADEDARSGSGGPLDAPVWVNPDRPVIAPPPPAPGVPPSDIGAPSQGAAPPDADDELHATRVSHQTSPEAARGPRRGRKAVWLGMVALASIVGLVFLVLGPLQRVTVPDVLGKTPTEAAAILATANLKLDAGQTEYSEDYPKGQIMGTDPAPDASARSGSTIAAVVSKGPERYDVPKLKGLTVKEAEVALKAVKLELGDQAEAYDDDVKKGDIISSAPPAGESVKPGTVVAVEVSKGPEPIQLPSLVGSDGSAAQKALKDLGLKVDRSDQFSESIAAGLVVSMDPASGTTVYRGDTVDLVVSKGPPLVTVPNVLRMREKQARAALEEAGFQVRVNKPAGFEFFGVSDQTPEGGEKAPKGSTVTITVV